MNTMLGQTERQQCQTGTVVDQPQSAVVEPPAVTASVILPVYNAVDTIGRAVESVLSQTLRTVEIIACDDCSRDASFEVLRDLAAKDSRLRVLRSPCNRGPAATRNEALALATGRWVAVLDSDDWYAPERLEYLVRLGEETGADFVADNQVLFDAGVDHAIGVGLPPGDGFTTMTLDDLLRNSLTGRVSYDYGLLQPMIRRSFLNERGIRYLEHVRYGEDFLLALDCLAAGAKAVVSYRPMYYVTQPYGSKSGEMSRPDRVIYDFAAMKRANEMAVERYNGRITKRQLRLLRRRSRSIDLFIRYISLATGGWARPWRLAPALFMPSLWPFFGQSIARKAKVVRAVLRGRERT